MPSLLQIIKQAAVEAVEASDPIRVRFGTVSGSSVKLDQKLTVPSSFLVYTTTAKQNVRSGDKVVLLQVQGGQKYIVLDKVGDY